MTLMEPTSSAVRAVRGDLPVRRLEMRIITLLRNSGVFLPEGTALLRKKVLLDEWVSDKAVLWVARGPGLENLHVYSRWPLSVLCTVGISLTTDAAGDVAVNPSGKLWDDSPSQRRHYRIRDYLMAKERVISGRPLEKSMVSTGAIRALENIASAFAALGQSCTEIAPAVQAKVEKVEASA